MTRASIGTVDELARAGRLLASVDGREVVVFKAKTRLVAYENVCPHLGGPVGAGRIVPRIDTLLGPDGAVVEERFVHNEPRLACPWHGYEFDLETGVCPFDSRYSLRPVTIEEEGGDIYVVGSAIGIADA